VIQPSRALGASFVSLLSPLLLLGCAGGREEAPLPHPRAFSVAPTVSSARSLGATNALPAWAQQKFASVAYGGGVFMTAWADYEHHAVFAARTRASDGLVLDQRIPLDTPRGHTSQTAIASDGQGFLVVWKNYDQIYNIYFRRLDSDGKVLDPVPLTIAAPTATLADETAVAFDGTNYLIVWGERPNSAPSTEIDLRAARIRPADGTLVGSPFVVTATAGVQSMPVIAADGTNSLVLWRDVPTGSIMGNRVRASDGAVLDGDGFPVHASTGPATVAFDGTNYLVVWEEGGTRALMGTRIRPSDHQILDPAGLPIAQAPQFVGANWAPRLTFDGTHHVVIWRNQGANGLFASARLFAARIKPDTGQVVDTAGILVDDRPGQESYGSLQGIAAGGGRLFAAWNRQREGQSEFNKFLQDVYGRFLDPATGAVAGPSVVVSRSSGIQYKPSASFDGDVHLVTWHEWNGDRFAVRAARVSQQGTVLDPAGLAVSGASTKSQLHPQAASNGSNHLVVWGDGTGLRAMRIRGSDGMVLDPGGVAVPATTGVGYGDRPSFGVASDGNDYLLAWAQSSASVIKVRATRIRGSDGAFLDATPKVVAPDSSLRFLFKVTFSGSNYVVLGVEGPSYDALGVTAVRLAVDGTVLDATPRTVAPVSSSFKAVVAAGDGENLLVAWEDAGKVRGRRLRLTDGVVLDSADIAINGSSGSWSSYFNSLAAAFDGTDFLLAWSDWRNVGHMSDLYGARVSRAGALRDPTGFAISTGIGWNEHDPALSPADDGSVLAIYNLFETTADMTDRLQARLLTEPPPPPDAAPPVDVGDPSDLPVAMTDASPEASPPDAGAPPIDAAADTSPPSPPIPPADAAADSPADPSDAAPTPPADAAADSAADPPDAVSSLPIDVGPLPADAPAAALDVAAAPDLAAPASDALVPPVGADAAPAPALDASSTGDGPPADATTGGKLDGAFTGPALDAASPRDASQERPGNGGGLVCRMGDQRTPPSTTSLLLASLLLGAVGLRRARRRRRDPRASDSQR
jgi:hypothetical protein